MFTVDQAQQAILENVQPLSSEAVGLQNALGSVLAAPVVSDMAMPPFDKAAVDGFACRTDDACEGNLVEVVERITAGQQGRCPVASGSAVQVMTGCPVPPGTETVVMVEDTRPEGSNKVRITKGYDNHRNICDRGEDLRAGATVIEAGELITPHHIAVMAAQGAVQCTCVRRATVAVLATGDEIVPIDKMPAPTQIRNSNNASLLAQAHRAGTSSVDLGIAADDESELQAKIMRGMEADVLLLSGGVSAGTRDLVPAVLASCGLHKVFHQAAIKPGKPILYGRTHDCHIFGLPGNPVSTFVNFEVLVRPLLRALMGQRDHFNPEVSAVLTNGFKKVDVSERYIPATLAWRGQSGYQATLVIGNGPADVVALARADALVRIPPGTGPYAPGDRAGVILT